MGLVINFPRHLLSRCRGRCESEGSCVYCDGGLSHCERCGGAEGSLPSSCPGLRMQPKVVEAVYAGRLDFTREQGWHQPRPDRRWRCE